MTISNTKKYLETARLYLTPITKEDVENLLQLDRDPDVMKYISDGQPSLLSEIEATIERTLGYYHRFHHRLGAWVAIDKRTEAFMGWFHLRPNKDELDNVRDLEIGYRLMKKFWNKGLATECTKALIDKAFLQLGAESVYAVAMAANRPSIKVLEKSGLFIYSDFVDDKFLGADKNAVKYVLPKNEWLKARAEKKG